MDRPVFLLTESEAQRYALEVAERTLTAEELDRLAEVLRYSPDLRGLIDRVIRVVTTPQEE